MLASGLFDAIACWVVWATYVESNLAYMFFASRSSDILQLAHRLFLNRMMRLTDQVCQSLLSIDGIGKDRCHSIRNHFRAAIGVLLISYGRVCACENSQFGRRSGRLLSEHCQHNTKHKATANCLPATGQGLSCNHKEDGKCQLFIHVTLLV